MSEFRDLIDYCYALSLATKLRPTEDSVFRSICRTYSKRFSTELGKVINELDPMEVILHVYEDDLLDTKMEGETFDKLYDIIRTMEDPTYERRREEEMDKVVEQALKEEAERVEKGLPVARSKDNKSAFAPKLKKNESDIPVAPESTAAALEGGADLSSLEEEDPGEPLGED